LTNPGLAHKGERLHTAPAPKAINLVKQPA
jgi:hypothetical protein